MNNKAYVRTDLAVEVYMDVSESIPSGKGYTGNVTRNESSVTTVIDIETEEGEKIFGKPKGRYVTVEVPPMGKDAEVADGRLDAVAEELAKLIPTDGPILVVGLGNRDITADAVGPIALTQILATRHLNDRLKEEVGLSSLRDVSGIIPGVLGQTGIEVSDIVRSVADFTKPKAIISIDALAARELSRLGCTIQITDAGISPGSGIGNRRLALNKQTMGVPVIAIGVPTVISIGAVVDELPENSNSSNLIVTPKDIDLLVSRAARLIALAINRALFPSLSKEEILSLVS